MVSLFNSLPPGALWALAAVPIIGIVLVLWRDPIVAFVRRRAAPSGGVPAHLLLLLIAVWKVTAVTFYVFLFGFPLLFLFLFALPTIRVTRENQVATQDLMVYSQRRDAVALIVPEVDRNLPVSSAAQVKADADKLRSLFPDEKDRGRVLSWAQIQLSEHYPDRRWRLTDDQAAHIAWRFLSRVPGTKESDLLQLETIIKKAVPDAAARGRLLEWGRARNGHLDTSADLLLFTRLPKLDWFAWWTVYTEYCPTDDMLAARKQFLTERLGEHRFGRDVWKAFLAWGKESYERQPALARLLPAGERAYVVAAVERMVGLDEAGRKVYELDRANQLPTGKDYTLVPLGMHIFYPNDDLIYMQFGEGWYGEHSLFATGRGSFSPALVVIGLYLVFWALLVQRSMRRLTVHYLGRAAGVGGDPAFRRLEHGMFDPRLQLVALLVVVPLGWLFARLFMDDFYVFYFRSDINLVLAVVYSALICGALCEAVQNLIAVACVRCGRDPQRMFVDNLVAGGVGAAVLWFFQNSWFSIVSGLALGLFTSVVLKLFARRGRSGDGLIDRKPASSASRQRAAEAETPSDIPSPRRPAPRGEATGPLSPRSPKQGSSPPKRESPPPTRPKGPPQDGKDGKKR